MRALSLLQVPSSPSLCVGEYHIQAFMPMLRRGPQHYTVRRTSARTPSQAASRVLAPCLRHVCPLSYWQTGQLLAQACHDVEEAPGAWRAPAIPRGDLQATFVFKGFDEVQRLGLTHATEAAVRAASREAAQPGETACRHVHPPSA